MWNLKSFWKKHHQNASQISNDACSPILPFVGVGQFYSTGAKILFSTIHIFSGFELNRPRTAGLRSGRSLNCASRRSPDCASRPQLLNTWKITHFLLFFFPFPDFFYFPLHLQTLVFDCSFTLTGLPLWKAFLVPCSNSPMLEKQNKVTTS